MKQKAGWIQRRRTPRPKALWTSMTNQKKSFGSKRALQLAQYAYAKRVWVRENCRDGRCQRCRCQRDRMDIHHKRGRAGTLLLDSRHWAYVCAKCHRWIHANIEDARREGWICERGLWNVPHREGID